MWYPPRKPLTRDYTEEEIREYIDSRALEFPTQQEDEFVTRALQLGIESGMVLDVGTHVGLVPLKMVWQNENLVSIGLDTSGGMVERARETAIAWGMAERAVFQVGDPRRMRFKSSYFDVVVSDASLHRFDDMTEVLREINRVLKPSGALLIRDFRRPNRFRLRHSVREQSARHGNTMHSVLDGALRAAYTPGEMSRAMEQSGLLRARLSGAGPNHFFVERRGETDPNSWVTVREQYR